MYVCARRCFLGADASLCASMGAGTADLDEPDGTNISAPSESVTESVDCTGDDGVLLHTWLPI